MTKKFITSFDDSVIPNINEFKKSFLETFLWIKYNEHEAPFLIFIKETEDNYIYAWNNVLGNITISSENDYKIWAEWPETGYFYHSNNDKPTKTYWFSKKPARQWKKAACSANCSITQPQYYKYLPNNTNNYHYINISIDILLSAYTKEKETDLQSAAELVKLFNKEFIINKKYLLTPEINTKFKKTTGLLWFYFKPVARINLNNLNIVTLDNHFKKEVLQLYKESPQ